MIKSKIYLYAFIAMAIASVAGGHFVRGLIPSVEEITSSQIAQKLLSKPSTQNVSSRIWLPVTVNRIFSLASGEAFILYSPTIVRVDNNSGVYVLDVSDMKVKEFSTSGAYMRSYGNGKGYGPGEFQNPTDFRVDKHGNVWVADAITGIVTVFDHRGLVVNTFRPEKTPFRIVVLRDNEYAIFSSGVGDLFDIYNGNRRLKGVGQIFSRNADMSISLVGASLTIAQDTMLCYAGNRWGVIAEFSVTGRRIFFVQTVDKIPLPNFEMTKVGESKIARVASSASWSALDITSYGSKLYLFTYAGSIGHKGTVIDVYSANDGSYEGSFEIPIKCRDFDVNGKFIYTVEDTTLTKWIVG